MQGRLLSCFTLNPGATLRWGLRPTCPACIPAVTCCCAASAYGDAQGDSAAGNNVVCDFCQTAVQYIKIALDSNETMSQVCVPKGMAPRRLASRASG